MAKRPREGNRGEGESTPKRQARDVDPACPVCWRSSCELPVHGITSRGATPSAATLCCKASFCYGCLAHWVERETSCPTCRARLAGILQPHDVSPPDDSLRAPSSRFGRHVWEFLYERMQNEDDLDCEDGEHDIEEDVVALGNEERHGLLTRALSEDDHICEEDVIHIDAEDEVGIEDYLCAERHGCPFVDLSRADASDLEDEEEEEQYELMSWVDPNRVW